MASKSYLSIYGITSTITLLKGLSLVGLDVSYYIPRRLVDGYGMNMNSIYSIINAPEKVDLVITCDVGITAFEQVETLMENGIDVIVTDHHECKEELPKALAVIDNKRKDNTYPFVEICGAAVAYKVISALYKRLGISGKEHELLMYTALGTVSDVMPLIDENRIFVKEGLRLLQNTTKESITNLLKVAGKLSSQKELSAMDIGFYLGPLLNASSRIGDVSYAITLLTNEDHDICKDAALRLKTFNEMRKDEEKRIMTIAEKQIMESYDFNGFAPIVCYGKDFHLGVIGIVASRIVEKYNRCAIILSYNEQTGHYHGSCRSFGDVDMAKMLKAVEHTLIQFGGHKGAAGLSIAHDKTNDFVEELRKYSIQNFSYRDFIPYQLIDTEIYPEEITMVNFDKLKELAPFGNGNEIPIFICKHLKTSSSQKLISRKKEGMSTYKASFISGNQMFEAIGFFKGEYADIISEGDIVDVIFELGVNTYNGNTTLQMQISNILINPIFKEGLRLIDEERYHKDEIDILGLMNKYSLSIDELIPKPYDFSLLYGELSSLMNSQQRSKVLVSNINILAYVLTGLTRVKLTPFKLMRVLRALEELGKITFKLMEDEQVVISPSLTQKVIKLSETKIFQKDLKR